MSNWYEFTAKTVDEALTEALIKLETTSDQVEYEVIEKESNGVKKKVYRKSLQIF